MKHILIISLFFLAALRCVNAQDSGASQSAGSRGATPIGRDSGVLFSAEHYRLYPDRVTQPPFTAAAVSATELRSNYQSPGNPWRSSKISFKFSLNGGDNEMRSGSDDHFYCTGLSNETPLIRFGEPLPDTMTGAPPYMQQRATLKVRLDMRKVLAGFASDGYYTLYNGERFYKKDFKGVYMAGDAAPLTWDFSQLAGHPDLQLQDNDGDGIYELTLVLNKVPDRSGATAVWKGSKDISAFPQYHSPYVITDAVYNLALEEMINAVEPDSTFRTGKLWSGVWTRDISYSIILSMAYLQPRVAMKSLLRKVNKKKRIIQDTGTGGAYPVSSDRMIWAVAAWEVYEATGDEDWLNQAYTIVKNSLDDDWLNCYDRGTGLVRGESSFLDWREQTYPAWMQPADIYASENLGTNAVHYEANLVLSRMAMLLHHPAEAQKRKAVAAGIKAGINRYLWQENKGYYAQYLYGRKYPVVSGRAEALGEALCILFGVADGRQQAMIVSHMPVTAYGIPCIYPEIPGIPPYHNNAVWPFVESFWGQASARAGNESAVMEAFGAVYRAAALFLTNKENFTAENGDFASTQINSDNMLWSLAGNISLVHKILFGIEFRPGSLYFHPFVPVALQGRRSLDNFLYRGAVLNISLEGYGDVVAAFFLDGGKMSSAVVPANLTGPHTVRIVLGGYWAANHPVAVANQSAATGHMAAGHPAVANHLVASVNHQPVYFTPAAPAVRYEGGYLRWDPVEGAAGYRILKNGRVFSSGAATGRAMTDQPATRLAVPDTAFAAEWQVEAIDSLQVSSFASEPVTTGAGGRQYMISLLPSATATGAAAKTKAQPFKTTSTINQRVAMTVDIVVAGFYALDLHYANGNGPINTSNKCAIRTLREEDKFLGTIVLPQRGEDWEKWGFSNAVTVYLSKGRHNLQLVYEPQNENMNGEVNEAMLDYLRIVPLDRRANGGLPAAPR